MSRINSKFWLPPIAGGTRGGERCRSLQFDQTASTSDFSTAPQSSFSAVFAVSKTDLTFRFSWGSKCFLLRLFRK